ncbi:MAG: DUF2599 domain-containing protein [Bifidobacteriaceae bacterium]|jgi:hypothetical protein|nr:DUF2599 domain-containing protein [Bifidobacteriaceae bacterium]
MKPIRRGILGIAMGMALVMAGAPAAYSTPGAGPGAADASSSEILELLGAVAAESNDPATQVLEDVADIAAEESGSSLIDAEVGGVEIEIAADATGGIALSDETAQVEIALPFAERADSAVEVADGVVAYDNNNGSVTVPVVKSDGTVQVATIIEDQGAPTMYTYDLDLGVYALPIFLDNGGIIFNDQDGAFVLGVAPPWAVDASGAAVPTHYELAGGRLTQVVDHRAAATAYPVVADPVLGIDLFSKTKRTTSSKGFTVSATLSWLGQALVRSLASAPVLPGLAGTGYSVMVGAGWSELVKKQSTVNTTPMYNQYVCHVTYGWTLRLSDTWDLESWRAKNTNPATWVSKKCNW